MEIQVRGFKLDEHGRLGLVARDEAQFFSIFVCAPSGEEWIADFKYYADALDWAEETAIIHECQITDMTETRH